MQTVKIEPKKVIILTGFLGAGKTTVLNAILRNNQKIRYAIIENEVGEIGIDGELIVKNTDSFMELNNGCICCSVNDDFNDTLKTLTQRNDWDELIIEATGIANPGGIISPFLTFPWLQKYFQTPEVICIADAKNIVSQLKISETAAAQLAYGDKIYLSKVDLAKPEEIDISKKLIGQFNPFASVVSGSRHDIPLTELLLKQKASKGKPEIKTPNNHHSHDHFEAVSLEYLSPFNENKLYAQLYYQIMTGAMKIYRIKGIFYDARKPTKIVIQSAMQSLLIEDGDLPKEDEPKVSKFVFIGKNLNSETLDEILQRCQV